MFTIAVPLPWVGFWVRALIVNAALALNFTFSINVELYATLTAELYTLPAQEPASSVLVSKTISPAPDTKSYACVPYVKNTVARIIWIYVFAPWAAIKVTGEENRFKSCVVDKVTLVDCKDVLAKKLDILFKVAVFVAKASVLSVNIK